MPNPFDVPLDDLDIAEAGRKPDQEGNDMPPRKKVQEEDALLVPSMEIDSPIRLWDVFGHIKLNIKVDDSTDIVTQIDEAKNLWAYLEDEYAEDIEAMVEKKNKVSAAQVALAETTAKKVGVELDDDFYDMTKAQASAVIEDLLEKQRVASRNPPKRVRSTRRSSRRGSSSSRGVTDKQLRFLCDLYSVDEVDDLPDDVRGMTSAKASEHIKELIAEE